MYMCVCSCILAMPSDERNGTRGYEGVAAGTGPERQRNHLDELPHTLPRVQWRSPGMRKKEKERERRVSHENCGPSGSRFTTGPENFVSVQENDTGEREGEGGNGRAGREARDSHVNWTRRSSRIAFVGLVVV